MQNVDIEKLDLEEARRIAGYTGSSDMSASRLVQELVGKINDLRDELSALRDTGEGLLDELNALREIEEEHRKLNGQLRVQIQDMRIALDHASIKWVIDGRKNAGQDGGVILMADDLEAREQKFRDNLIVSAFIAFLLMFVTGSFFIGAVAGVATWFVLDQ